MSYMKNENYSINELKYFLSNEKVKDIFIITGEKSFLGLEQVNYLKEYSKEKSKIFLKNQLIQK